jgi:uncharacterized protein YbbC (DUF1343 family)
MSTQSHSFKIQLGIDQLADDPHAWLSDQNVAVLCHAASVDQNYKHLIQILADAHIKVKRCFGPEHGIWADAQDMEAVNKEEIEPHTQAPVTSLYGSTLEQLTPLPEHFDGIDILVIDLQDIGTRYYTYIYTATLCASICAQTNTKVLILDRPNPLGGVAVEGNLQDPNYLSFVGLWPLPNRHGLTLGEVVTFLNDREQLGASIEVIEVQGWTRDDLLPDTQQRWVLPSPNMPTFEAMAVYPGMCLIEGTNISEGRGTTQPFEWIGAGFIKPFEWCKALNDRNLPGIHCRPLFFKPTFHKWAHESIGGASLHIQDINTFQPLRFGLHLLDVTRRLYGDQLQWREEAYEFVQDRLAIDLLFGGPEARECIDQGGDIDALWQQWQTQAKQFNEDRQRFLRY